MTKININIKVNEVEEIVPVIESVKKLELNKIAEYTPVVTVDLEDLINRLLNLVKPNIPQ